MAEGAHAPPVGAEERFGAVAGHVDAGGTVGGAGLAGQAQVEGLEDFGGVDGLNELRVRGLLEDAGAPSGHVLLVAGGQVGRAHERAGHSGAALAHARAAVDGRREVAAVVGEREAAVGGHGVRGDAAQVRIEGVNAGLELKRAVGRGAARVARTARAARCGGSRCAEACEAAVGPIAGLELERAVGRGAARAARAAGNARCGGSRCAEACEAAVGPIAGLGLERAVGRGAARTARSARAVGRKEVGTAGARVVTIADDSVRPSVCRQPAGTSTARRESPSPSAGGGLGLVHGGGEHPGVEEVTGVEDVLDAGEQVEHLGGVHEAQKFTAGAPVAVFAGDGAAVGGADAGRGLQERARVCHAFGGFEWHGEAHVYAAVAEVPVQEPVDVELLHEGGEVAQVRAEVFGRDGRVLEAGPGLLVAAARAVRRGAPAQAGSVGADPPQGRGLGPRRVHDRVDGGRVGAQGACALQGGGDVFAGGADFDEEPAFALGQGGDGAGALVGAHDVDEAAVHAFHGEGGVGQQRRHVVGGLDHGTVAEGREHGCVGQGYEAHGDGENQDEGTLGAGEHGGEVAPAFGGEVFEGVAGDLALEAAELRADGREVGVDEGGEPRHIAECGVVAGRGGEAAPLPVHAVEGDDVVGGAPPGGRVRAARVVGDHAGDCRAVLGGGVGAEAQAVLGRRSLQGGADAAGFDGGGAGLGVDGDDAVHVPREIEDEAGADRVGRARGAAASGGEGDAVGAGEVEGRDRLLGRAREGDGQGRDAREAGVGGVARSRADGGVDVNECAQVRQEAVAHRASVSRSRRGSRPFPLCGCSRGGCQAGSGSSRNILGKGVTGTGMRSIGGK